MSPRKRWLRIGLAAAIVVAGWLLYETFFTYNDVPALPPAQAPIFFQGGHVVNHHYVTKSWSLDYDSAQMTADQSSGTITGIHDGIIFKKGKPYLKISAQQASVNTVTLDFTATGKVHVAMLAPNAGRSFDTDLIVWSNQLHNLTLSHPSYVHTGGQTLKVETVTVNLDTDDIKMGKIDGTVDLTK